MALVKRRHWRTAFGEAREAWIVDYRDGDGVRRLRTFERKKEADGFLITVRHEVRQGTHTPASTSITFAQAGEQWLARCRAEGRERSTIEQYEQHVKLHIKPHLGRMKLSALTTPGMETFRDHLVGTLSRAMARKVLVTTKSILRDAQRRGCVAQNVAEAVRIKREAREKRLEVGVDIPTPQEIAKLVRSLSGYGRWQPFLMTAIFSGLRASELRGLRWCDVDLAASTLSVRQRCDRYDVIGPLKSRASLRTIPINPMLVNTLREYKIATGGSGDGLVFTSRRDDGAPVSYQRANDAATEAWSIVIPYPNKPYTGLHTFRHWYASWCINPKSAGGLGLSAKAVQQRMGHSSIVLTLDTYGHLFPTHDDGAELVAAERALLAAVPA
jgi:integrase